MQLLSASSNGLGEPWGLRGGGQHREQRKQRAWALRGSAEPQLVGMRGDRAVPGTHGNFSAATTEFFCPSCPQALCLRSNRSPPSQMIPRGAAQSTPPLQLRGTFVTHVVPVCSLLHGKEVTEVLPGPQHCPQTLSSTTCCAGKHACPGLQSRRGALPSEQGQRGPEIPHKDIRFGTIGKYREQIIYLPDLR